MSVSSSASVYSTNSDELSHVRNSEVKPAPSSILYQNQDATITLIDISRSIEEAQGTRSQPWNKRLFSSPPLERPYPSVEPKSQKALAALPRLSIEELLLEKHVHFALEEVKSNHDGQWCLPRVFTPEDPDENAEVGAEDRAQPAKKQKVDKTPTPSIAPVSGNVLETSKTTKSYYIPPNSNYCLGNIEDALIPQTLGPFNLILLDPPWPNRSARRSKHYATTPNIHDLLFSIPVPQCLSSNGLLGIWITNKPAYRTMATGSGGLFDQWGVELVEEWIWLKVTVAGEPIMPIGSTWRKPYEVLLVARKQDASETERTCGSVRKRVIVGVPDLHSRKPNLRRLFEPLLGEAYAGLEIFARNLTAGWWAWGDEVMKFQHVSCWSG